ncbi:FMN-binding glutamate synthase family protein [Fodinisporobacter ferrooxydans]
MILFARPLIQWILGRWIRRLMSDRYPENIWEMVTAMTRTSPQMVVENSLRAQSGNIIERPFGSPRKFLNFDGLIFSPAQLATLPAQENAPVDVKITIGPKSRKPLALDIPILAGAMGYGIGVTEKVRLAVAKGTAAVGTATNSGEGGFLPEDRANAKYYILQYNSAAWNKDPAILKQADAIEIHIGQGASAGSASFIPPEYMQGKAREILQVPDGETVVIPSRHKEIQSVQDLQTLVANLRQITGGVPIGVKICASAKLEADLEAAIQAAVDFISIDGGQAGTKGGPPILEDDFGLPTIFALSRAVAYFKKRDVKGQISVLIGGGFNNPGECLKALALGADGIFMGTAVLWAMTHDQVTKTIPWEPPTELVFYPGSRTEQFDADAAADHLKNFFHSFVEEIKVGIRALGKTSLQEVSRDDLTALDEWTSRVTKIPCAYEPFSLPDQNDQQMVHVSDEERLSNPDHDSGQILHAESQKSESRPKETVKITMKKRWSALFR